MKTGTAPCIGLMMGLVMGLVSCSTPSETADATAEGGADAAEPVAVAPVMPKVSLTEWTLLEMSFDEAKAISSQQAVVGPLFRVAGDTVEVLKTDDAGQPTKVRAVGHVFLEMGLADRATAVCDEATVTVSEAVLKGNPMMMQASRVAKSTSPKTSFRITDHLKVSGSFDLIRPEDLMQSILAASDPLLVAEPVKAER